MTDIQLYKQIENLPADIKKSVQDYIKFLVSKTNAPTKKTYKKLKERQYGALKGKFKMSADFDAPLDDFKDYM